MISVNPNLNCLLAWICFVNENNRTKDQFFYPQGHYHGEFTPEALAFNANLQEFTNRVSIICGLETSGKISALEAYEQIKQLWHSLKHSRIELIDAPPPPKPDLPPDE